MPTTLNSNPRGKRPAAALLAGAVVALCVVLIVTGGGWSWFGGYRATVRVGSLPSDLWNQAELEKAVASTLRGVTIEQGKASGEELAEVRRSIEVATTADESTGLATLELAYTGTSPAGPMLVDALGKKLAGNWRSFVDYLLETERQQFTTNLNEVEARLAHRSATIERIGRQTEYLQKSIREARVSAARLQNAAQYDSPNAATHYREQQELDDHRRSLGGQLTQLLARRSELIEEIDRLETKRDAAVEALADFDCRRAAWTPTEPQLELSQVPISASSAGVWMAALVVAAGLLYACSGIAARHSPERPFHSIGEARATLGVPVLEVPLAA